MKKTINDNRNDVFNKEVIDCMENLSEGMSEIQKEELKDIVEMVYKEGYLDGFKDTLFFVDL